ncbi:glycosyltransferase N-terminal domain-containing protein [Alphaproteobacteria bacterium]|nr:glycosyltransferase N-terminal domain-containing protein [Alphaproteobacteria bacterium]
MTPSLYNFVWRIIRPFIPLLLWYRIRRGKDLARLRIQRYGRTAQPITPPGPHCAGRIWLHAVSVGESVAALRLARALATHYPHHAFLITTNTITGYDTVLAGIAGQPDIAMQCAMQPLDHPDFVDRFLASWQPSAAIFMESDFWPNLILRSRQRGIPVIFASSQLSAKAVAGWIKRPALAQPLFAAAELILPVDAQQADQFRALIGTAHNIPRIQVIGSLKLPDRQQPEPQLQNILQQAASGRRVFLAASTHDGEDQIVIDAASDLGADWLTIIAPRHPDRGDAIAAYAGQPPQRSHGAIPDSQTSIYIMDSLSEMSTLFSLADYVFLGGSLVPAGGHNPLEPAGFGLPILTGAHIFKNKAEFDGLAAAGAVFEVADAATITHQIRQLENDPARRANLAKAAQDYVTIAHQRVALAAQAIKQVLTTVR